MQTPYYLIHRDAFIKNCNDIISSFAEKWKGKVGCGYSVKTNNSPQMLQLALEQGLYAEVVSEQEYMLVKKCGFADDRVIYNGPIKGKAKFEACKTEAKINIDNLNEAEEIALFIKENKIQNVHLGLRVNFDLESMVPGETSTGERVGRFGICYENGDLEKALSFLKEEGIALEGLHVHFTTKTRSIAVFAAIAKVMCEICQKYHLNLKYIDIGGGFWGGRALAGKPTMQQYAEAIVPILRKVISSETELIVEPGSAMCATVVDYITTVISVKEIRNTRIVVVDGTLLHINPFMNQRQQTVVLPEDGTDIVERQEICGATCLEHDRFLILQKEKAIQVGSKITFTNAGAYTMSLVSDFIVTRPNVYISENRLCEENG